VQLVLFCVDCPSGGSTTCAAAGGAASMAQATAKVTVNVAVRRMMSPVNLPWAEVAATHPTAPLGAS